MHRVVCLIMCGDMNVRRDIAMHTERGQTPYHFVAFVSLLFIGT